MVLKRIMDFLNYWYLQYTLNTAVYMLEPTEIRIVNSMIVAAIAFCLYSACVFLPGHFMMLMEFYESFQNHNATTVKVS